jgi:small subunit ribosomal protein S6
MAMAHYEIMVLFDSNGNHEPAVLAEAMKQLIGKFKGTISVTDDWGEKSLAYRIKGKDRGHYIVYDIEIEPQQVKKMANQLRLDKEIMRYLITKTN